MSQDLYDKAKIIIKQDAYLKFYNASKPLYLETDAYGVGLEAGLLQVREGMNYGCDEVTDNMTLCPTAFASTSMMTAEWQDSNINGKHSAYHMGLRSFTITVLSRKYM